MVCYHLAKLGGHWYCTSGDILFLICQLITQDPYIKGSGGYNNRISLR